MDTIIKGGTIVTASDAFQGDVGIADGKIVQIGQNLSGNGNTRVISAEGRYVMPGGIDIHTHLDSRSQETVTADDYRSGTIAAACGGTTTIVDFVGQEKGQSLFAAIESYHDRSEGRAAIDFGFHSIITDMNDSVFQELARLPEAGVTSFKVFLAYKGDSMVDDWTLLRTLQQARDYGALVMVHAENGDAAEFLRQQLIREGKTDPKYHATSRPPRVEAEACARSIAFAEIIGTPLYIVHVSCAEAIDEIERGRARGVRVLAETCPQYLYLTEADLDRPGFEGAKYVFTPPPRGAEQREVVWAAIADDTLQVVSSDHAPYNFKGEKDRGMGDFTKIPNGAPGIEERMMLVFQGVNAGRFSPSRFVELTATAPAKIFGLYPNKGTIAPGSDADLVIWNPEARLTLGKAASHSAVDYSMFEGLEVQGAPETVLLRGETIVEGREFVGRSGYGRFIRRKRFGE
jgi:dihydropyrimidinase